MEQIDLKEFGRRLRGLRKDKKMTQKEVGTRLGVTENMVAHFEAGRRFPRLDQLLILVNLFDVDPSYLTLESDHKMKYKKAEELLFELIKAGLVDDSEGLDDMDKIIKTVKKLQNKKE